MQVTPLGKSWEWRNSIWLIWLLFPFGFATFISFLYIGIRARRTRWIVSSMIYFAITLVYFYISDNYDIEHIAFETIMVIVLTAWITAWIQAFRARREYLRIRVAQMMVEQELLDEQIAAYERVYSTKLPKASHPLKSNQTNESKQEKTLGHLGTSVDDKTAPSTEVSEPSKPTTLNINRATEQQIQRLPSMDLMSATEIVRTRESKGPFTSYSHLIQTLNVQPHVFLKAKPFMVFSDDDLSDSQNMSEDTRDYTTQQQGKTETGKAQNKKRKRGRIVDY